MSERPEPDTPHEHWLSLTAQLLRAIAPVYRIFGRRGRLVQQAVMRDADQRETHWLGHWAEREYDLEPALECGQANMAYWRHHSRETA